MRKLSYLLIICLLFFSNAGNIAGAAAVPQRVAILPVYVNTSGIDEEVLAIIEKALADKFHTALANIVPVYHLIPPPEIAPALPAALTDGKQKIRLDKTALITVAEKLDADIVIVAEVTRFSSSVYMDGEGDYIRTLGIALRLLSYHRPSGEFVANSDHFNYVGADYLAVQPDNVAKQLIDGLLGKVPAYRQIQ